MTFPLMPTVSVVTGGTQSVSDGGTFTVPLGISTISVSLYGARGGKGGNVSWNYGSASGGSGGYGALVTQNTLSVTPGEVLTVSGGVSGTVGSNYTGTVSGGTGGAGGTGTQILLKRGATTLMSANGGGGGSGARCGYTGGAENPYTYAGGPGANSGTGTGGTVTSGGGASSSGYASFTWS